MCTVGTFCVRQELDKYLQLCILYAAPTCETDCLSSICPLLRVLQGAAGGVQTAEVEARGGSVSSYAD